MKELKAKTKRELKDKRVTFYTRQSQIDWMQSVCKNIPGLTISELCRDCVAIVKEQYEDRQNEGGKNDE